MTFDHVGIPTDEKQPGENWVESTHVWVTSPRDSKFRIEYLRFAGDSPCAEIVRTRPHIAYAVNVEEWHACSTARRLSSRRSSRAST